MQRGRPLAVWGGLLACAGLWLVQRWPAMQAEQRQLALALAAADQPALAVGPPLERSRPMVAAQVVLLPEPRAVWKALPPPRRVALPPVSPAGLPLLPPDQPVSDLAPPPQAAPALLPTNPAPAPPESAYRLAEAAYARLAAGERRAAAALFDAALALEPGNRQWRQDRAALGQRWQVSGFALLRDGGGSAAGGPAASPVLGGGQLGASVAVFADPLARRPLALVSRAFVAADARGVQRETAQAAIGLRQTLVPGVTLSAERLIALGSATRGDWTLRLAGGGRSGRFEAYGEAGVLGSGQIYGGAQASARLVRIGPAALAAAGWASLQTGNLDVGPDVWRVDVGPQVSAQWRALRLQADWRQRVAGNAAPGSGPVVTLSTGF